MKKIITFIAAIMIAASSCAQVHKAVDNKIRNEYKEDYELISIDTVAMPIRILMSLEFAMTADYAKATEKLKTITELAPDLQPVALKKLVETMEKNLNSLVKIEDIVAMRDSNAPHEDDYYNYQRTKVYLKKSQREETFYIHLGENSISRTQVEYNNLEASAFLKYWQYRDLHKELKRILNMY